MKYPVRRFRDLAVALRQLEPFIRNGQHLETGKPFERFGGMRSREMLANWLLCVVSSSANGTNLTFSTDPIGGDGIIRDDETEETWQTEHVFIPKHRSSENGDAHTLILEAIEKKRSKREAAYASGKTLVIFLNAKGGNWHPKRVARQLPDPLHFAAVWVVGLQVVENGEYVYGVTHLDLTEGDAPTFIVRIKKDFDDWTVTRIQ